MVDVSGEFKDRLDKHSDRINDNHDRLIRVETRVEGVEGQMSRISDNLSALQTQQAENHKETTSQLNVIHRSLGEDSGRRAGAQDSRAVHLGYGTLGLAALVFLAKIAGLW